MKKKAEIITATHRNNPVSDLQLATLVSCSSSSDFRDVYSLWGLQVWGSGENKDKQAKLQENGLWLVPFPRPNEDKLFNVSIPFCFLIQYNTKKP